MADKQVSYEFNNFESFKMISVRDSWKIKFWFLFIFAIEEGVSELHTMAVSRSQNKVWYSGDLKCNHLKSWLLEFQMIRFLNGRSLVMGIVVMVPNIWKPDFSKSGHFCLYFKWFLTKWRPFVWISMISLKCVCEF